MVSDGTKACTWLQLRVAVLLFHVLEFLLKNNLKTSGKHVKGFEREKSVNHFIRIAFTLDGESLGKTS